MTADTTLLLKVEANKKSEAVAVLLNLFIPGAGYVYCGRWILGIIAFVLAILWYVMFDVYGSLVFALLLVIDGLLTAKRYNKRLIEKLIQESEQAEAQRNQASQPAAS